MLSDCPVEVLQRVLRHCDSADLFLLRQVSRTFRVESDRCVRRIVPKVLPANLGTRFPGVESLDLQDCSQEEIEESFLSVGRQLPNLREVLGFSGQLLWSYGAEQDVEFLSKLTSLGMTHSDYPFSYAVFAQHCRSLQRLSIEHGHFQLADFDAMFNCIAASLTEIELSGVRRSFAAEAEAEHLDLSILNNGKVRSLKLRDSTCCHPSYGSGIFAADLSQLSNFTAVQTLDLSNNVHIDDIEVWELNALTRLTSLNLSGNRVSSGGLRRLALPGIQELCVADSLVTSPNGLTSMVALGFPNLTSLDISECKYLAPHSCFSVLSKLTRLKANETRLLQGPEALAALSQLHDLEMLLCVSDGSELAHLSGLLNLTRLQLSPTTHFQPTRTLLSSSHLGWLGGMTALHQLSLAENFQSVFAFEEGALEQLSGLAALRQLNLLGTELPRESVLPALKELHLECLQLPRHFASLQQELPARLRVACMRGDRQRSEQIDDDE